MNKSAARLDIQVTTQGLADSRSKAQALILAGRVTVDGVVVRKAGHLVQPTSVIEVAQPQRFVSRGGEKLDAALTHFGIGVRGMTVLDAGISTGGFTDCLLQRGAALVYGVDVGYGDVALSLRQHPRVQLLERTNLRYLFSDPSSFTNSLETTCDLVTLDLSFISIRKVLPTVCRLLKPAGRLLALVKPQFELERGQVGKGGIVREPELQSQAVDLVAHACRAAGLTILGSFASPVVGAKGNQEIFLYAQQPPPL